MPRRAPQPPKQAAGAQAFRVESLPGRPERPLDDAAEVVVTALTCEGGLTTPA
jgi:hypothetical protein